MLDLVGLIPIITGVVSSSIQIGLAIHRWWQSKRDQRAQINAVQTSQQTADAAKELQSLMDVQSTFWRTNPRMLETLGREATSTLSYPS